MEILRIKPIQGKLIRDPKTGKRLTMDRVIAVPRSSYWLRRLKDGDVEQVILKKANVGTEPEKIEKKPKSKDNGHSNKKNNY